MLTVLLTPEAERLRETWGTGWGMGPLPSTARQLGWVGTAHTVQRPALLPLHLYCLFLASVPDRADAGGPEAFLWSLWPVQGL